MEVLVNLNLSYSPEKVGKIIIIGNLISVVSGVVNNGNSAFFRRKYGSV